MLIETGSCSSNSLGRSIEAGGTPRAGGRGGGCWVCVPWSCHPTGRVSAPSLPAANTGIVHPVCLGFPIPTWMLRRRLGEECSPTSSRQQGFIWVILEGKQSEGAVRAPSHPLPQGGHHSSPSWFFRARSWATWMLAPPQTTTTTEPRGGCSRLSCCSRCSRPV